MKTLPTTFNDDGKILTMLDREGDVAIFSYGNEHRPLLGYEIVKIRKYAETTFRFKDKETGEEKVTQSPAREAMPPTSAWGDEGWTIQDRDRAYERFVALALSSGPSAIIGMATGRARGRARNEFELDLSSLTGEFEFSNVKSLYPETDEPMLRNRLRAELEAGFVRVVREIPGGRGKPRKVYEIVK